MTCAEQVWVSYLLLKQCSATETRALTNLASIVVPSLDMNSLFNYSVGSLSQRLTQKKVSLSVALRPYSAPERFQLFHLSTCHIPHQPPATRDPYNPASSLLYSANDLRLEE